jgi:hypothetical protein
MPMGTYRHAQAESADELRRPGVRWDRGSAVCVRHASPTPAASHRTRSSRRPAADSMPLQAIARSPPLATNERSFKDGPRGRFSPRSH